MTDTPTLLLTRPLAQSQRFAAQCQGVIGATFQTRISPVLRIAFLPVPDLSDVAGVIFTSENGVRAVAGRARAIPAYCVGGRTASAAAELGFVARAAGGTAPLLAAMIRQAKPVGTLLHLRGTHQTGDLAADLRATGIRAADHVVYDQQEQPLDPVALQLLTETTPVILPIFSTRSARLLLDQSGPLSESVQVVAISPGVAAACSGRVTRVSIAQTPDADGMIAEISRRMVA